MAKEFNYSDLLKHPFWQRKRLEIMERDNFTCVKCASKEKHLNVHHLYYDYSLKPWEYPPESLLTLCADCHSEEHNTQEINEGIFIIESKRLGILRSSLLSIILYLRCLKNWGLLEDFLAKADRESKLYINDLPKKTIHG